MSNPKVYIGDKAKIKTKPKYLLMSAKPKVANPKDKKNTSLNRLLILQ